MRTGRAGESAGLFVVLFLAALLEDRLAGIF
jgi:hypothetical protein